MGMAKFATDPFRNPMDIMEGSASFNDPNNPNRGRNSTAEFNTYGRQYRDTVDSAVAYRASEGYNAGSTSSSANGGYNNKSESLFTSMVDYLSLIAANTTIMAKNGSSNSSSNVPISDEVKKNVKKAIEETEHMIKNKHEPVDALGIKNGTIPESILLTSKGA